jgi:hypothetical protein
MADLLLEYDDPERLMAAARHLRAEGARFDAFTPYPLRGLAELTGFRDTRIARLTFAGGVIGAGAGFGMQVATNLAYPIEIGGRPLVAWPAFMLITFELMVLGAVLFAIGGMLALNRLPRLNHPVFDDPRFSFANGDRFFLLVRDGNQADLATLGARSVAETAA